MKQIIVWIMLVVLIAICLGLAAGNYWQANKYAHELAAEQSAREKAEQNVRELSKQLAQLQKDQPPPIQSQATSNEQPVEQQPGSQLLWATSEDGLLQVKLAAERDLNRPGQPLKLLFIVKNNSTQSLAIDAPLLDPWDIDLSRDGERVRWRGPVPSPAISQPVTLQPGEVKTFTLLLTAEYFFEFANEGAFQVELTYRSGFQNTWKGSIGPLTARWVQEVAR